MADNQDDLAKLSFLKEQVTELTEAGKFNEAVPLAQEILELCEKTLGPDDPEIVGVLNYVALLYSKMPLFQLSAPERQTKSVYQIFFHSLLNNSAWHFRKQPNHTHYLLR
jgi:hypothetical protein